MQEFEITSNEANQRLDKLLGKYLKLAPKSFLYKMLRKKNITLNNKKANGSEKVNIGDTIKMFMSDETIAKFSSEVEEIKTGLTLDIIYEDSNIILVNKPANMLSQKAHTDDISINEHIISYLLETDKIHKQELQTFKPSICNRLDRNTTGLIAAGVSLAGLQLLSQLFKERSLDKYYRCIVMGNVTEDSYIKGFLCKNTNANIVEITQEDKNGYLPIETYYEPIRSNDNYTLLEVKLITGRTHQIRAHLSSIGHPIIGDVKYGNKKANQNAKVLYNVRHQLLHSYRLKFPDTFTEKMEYIAGKEFIAPLPIIYEKLMN